MSSTGGRCCQHERWFADKAKRCRKEPCCVDRRSSPRGCPSCVLSTRAMSTGARFCRQGHSWRPLQQLGPCLADKNNVGRSKVLPTGAMFCRQEHPWRPFQQLGRPGGPIWAALEPVWPAWGPFEIATRRCFVDRSNVLWTGAALEAVPAAGATWEACLGGL